MLGLPRPSVLSLLPSALRGLTGRHKYHWRAPNSRPSPFPLSTYVPCACDSNNYYIRKHLTSYQKRGTIDREPRLPARFRFPFWNSPSPRTLVLLFCTSFSAGRLCPQCLCVILSVCRL